MITVCFTYFRSLTLTNLSAALFALRQQDFSRVKEIVIIDNNTEDSVESIQATIDSLNFPVPAMLHSFKHGDASKAHSWSTNTAVARVTTQWIFFTRADYLLDSQTIARFSAEMTDPNRFIVCGYYDVGLDVVMCDKLDWRKEGVTALRVAGREYDHVLIDSGVWGTSKTVFDRVGGLDERLTAWGHAQTHFQHKVFLSGAEFVRIPEVLFYHPRHGYETPRDHSIATRQLKEVGVGIKEMWARYNGPDHPYR